MGNSLEFIMNYEKDDLETLFYQTFSVETEHFGETIIHDLIPDGREVYVD